MSVAALLLFFALMSLSVETVSGQSQAVSRHSTVAKALERYEWGFYDQAVSSLHAAIRAETLEVDELCAALELLGRCYVRLGDQARARSAFKELLRLRPEWELDVRRVPPDELQVFRETKGIDLAARDSEARLNEESAPEEDREHVSIVLKPALSLPVASHSFDVLQSHGYASHPLGLQLTCGLRLPLSRAHSVDVLAEYSSTSTKADSSSIQLSAVAISGNWSTVCYRNHSMTCLVLLGGGVLLSAGYHLEGVADGGLDGHSERWRGQGLFVRMELEAEFALDGCWTLATGFGFRAGRTLDPGSPPGELEYVDFNSIWCGMGFRYHIQRLQLMSANDAKLLPTTP